MAEQLEVDVFWSFRSPWSYLATPRLREWQERYLLKVNLRVVYPIAIRTPEFFDQVQPQWFSYFGQRRAPSRGIPQSSLCLSQA